MLVLTQKEGEILQIGDNVKIYIKRVKGNWVRLCIDAPREVTLLRIPVDKAAREGAGDGAGGPGNDGAHPRGQGASGRDGEHRGSGRRSSPADHAPRRSNVVGFPGDKA